MTDLSWNILYLYKVKLILGQAVKAKRENRGIYFYLGARWGSVVNATPRPRSLPVKRPVDIV